MWLKLHSKQEIIKYLLKFYWEQGHLDRKTAKKKTKQNRQNFTFVRLQQQQRQQQQNESRIELKSAKRKENCQAPQLTFLTD